ncbi:MAG TPA: NF038122 family metalloprotease [Tepidisphaeraceae bacterium]|jgi:hypothetical protein|nr:NF038122 family metalloprotease [Tepidisphaeraceae bacterium]
MWKKSAVRGVSLASAVCLAGALGISTPARANLIITPTFDTSIINDSNATTIEAGINAAIGRLESFVLNNVSVTITFQETSSGLGGSSTAYYTVPYTTYLSELGTKQTLSANDTTAIASLSPGPNNPVNGDPNIREQTALARTLGYANYSGSDGTISLNTSIMNLSRTGTQNPSYYDLQAVAGHEIDEVLGIGGPGSALQLTGAYSGQASPSGAVGVLDLYRYSAANTRSFTMDPSKTAYFSINGGVTPLVYFNQNGANGADFADWGNGGTGTGDTSGNSPAQLQDAYGGPGAQVNLGTNEITALDIIGYNVVPEPASCGLFLMMTATALITRRRRITIEA